MANSQPETVVSAVPAADTPAVNNGTVEAISQVGSRVVLGGSFTSASPADEPATKYSLPHVLAFNANTGAIDTTGFRPVVNGAVETVVPGPSPGEVYIGGAFTRVDGVKMDVALLNLATGALVPSWKPTAMTGQVNRLVLARGRLFVGGYLSRVAGAIHRDLVALQPTTGTLRPFVALAFTGHHNSGTTCNPRLVRCPAGRVGVKAFDVNPAGNKLVAVGNFTSVGRFHRDQIVVINLGKRSAVVDARWRTLAYTAACLNHAFDSYVRDVQFSPTGSYFVVVAAGGIGTNSDGSNSSCDAAVRFDTNSVGADVRRVWVDYTGEDSLMSVAVTSAAVYVGGHQRWVDNSLGHNAAGLGAVPRPGVAALGPTNGLPLLWNPGRNPRGVGCDALLATARGLWMGSDTNYVGDRTYLRAKIAFFPLAGGTTVPPTPTPSLPGRVYLAGSTSPSAPDSNRFVYREFNGATAGLAEPVTSDVHWGEVHGAFTVAGAVIYGRATYANAGNLYERSFDGSTFGPAIELDPFHDPTWEDVKTGSGQTYQSRPSSFSSEIHSVTSMFFKAGRLYYTMAGQSAIHWRWFEPESGVIGSSEFTAPGKTGWSNVAGAFLAGSTLYYAEAGSGHLRSVRWTVAGGATGPSRLVSASSDWASSALFLLGNSTNPTPRPSAAFSSNCGNRPTCTFDAQPWVDPDGGMVRYAWNFGDGTRASLSTGSTVSHTYLRDGAHTVTLSVVTTAGATSSVSRPVRITAPIKRVAFVASAKAVGTGATGRIQVPRRSRARDALVLFDSYASTKARLATPTGWRLVGKTRRRGLTTAVFVKVATARDVRHPTLLRYSRDVHSSMIVAVYDHTSSQPLEASAVAVGSHRAHPQRTLHHLSTGSWVVGYWTNVSRHPNRWSLPATLKSRGVARGLDRPAVGGIVADRGTPCHGACRLGTAWTQRAGVSSAQWEIALLPALS